MRVKVRGDVSACAICCCGCGGRKATVHRHCRAKRDLSGAAQPLRDVGVAWNGNMPTAVEPLRLGREERWRGDVDEERRCARRLRLRRRRLQHVVFDCEWHDLRVAPAGKGPPRKQLVNVVPHGIIRHLRKRRSAIIKRCKEWTGPGQDCGGDHRAWGMLGQKLHLRERVEGRKVRPQWMWPPPQTNARRLGARQRACTVGLPPRASSSEAAAHRDRRLVAADRSEHPVPVVVQTRAT
eukprot:scaffold31815_cov118-Isochrysis_galbana.AAC.24